VISVPDVLAPLLAGALLAVVAAALAARVSVRRWLAWADRAVEYASAEILRAEDVDSAPAVDTLRARFDAWTRVVATGARFCATRDEAGLRWIDVAIGPDARGFNDDHRYIRLATAERVRRLRDISDRLRRGQTRLRSTWVPNV